MSFFLLLMGRVHYVCRLLLIYAFCLARTFCLMCTFFVLNFFLFAHAHFYSLLIHAFIHCLYICTFHKSCAPQTRTETISRSKLSQVSSQISRYLSAISSQISTILSRLSTILSRLSTILSQLSTILRGSVKRLPYFTDLLAASGASD